MATYKVIQDIEAEDKLVGPLSFRQFVYALITLFLFYLSFLCITKHIAFLTAFLIPPGLFTGFLAFPFGKDQPTEVWALAKLRFLLKSRRRVWDQTGVKELVTVTAPKKIEVVRTNGLDQSEVHSRLKALADTIDTRGWAIKNVGVNLYKQTGQAQDASDRLIDINDMPQPVPDYEVQASEDILDEHSNPVAQQMDQMITASSHIHRQKLIDELNDIRSEEAVKQSATPEPGVYDNGYWFMQPHDAAPVAPTPIGPQSIDANKGTGASTTADEQVLLKRLRAQNNWEHISQSHLRTVQPIEPQSSLPIDLPSPMTRTLQSTPAAGQPVTAIPDPAILTLANNNDLNVTTLAHEAHKAKNNGESPHDEVVISLR